MSGLISQLGEKFKKTMVPIASEKEVVELVRRALAKVMDPDLHRDIVSLGFVKEIKIKNKKAFIRVQLTTPACPAKEMLRKEIEDRVLSLQEVESCDLEFSAEIPRGNAKRSADTLAALGQVKNIVAIASGKGGVGKSTTTVNLALALAQSGSKVGILDADVHGPSVPIMTGVGEPVETIDKMVVPPEAIGMKIISVEMFTSKGKANIMRGPMTSQIIRQFLTQIAWGELDYLLIDYPPGTGDIQLSLSQLAPLSGVVIVTTPQEVALADVRKAVTMFNTTKIPILGVVETMSYFICDGCDKKHPIFDQGGGLKIANEHGVPLLGEIPIDPAVTKGGDSGSPVVMQDGAPADAYRKAAGQLASQISIINLNTSNAMTQFSIEWQ